MIGEKRRAVLFVLASKLAFVEAYEIWRVAFDDCLSVVFVLPSPW